MLKIKDSETENPRVNWANRTAHCICSMCGKEQEKFSFFDCMRFDGANFIYTSGPYGCGCSYTTIYPVDGPDPECRILKRMLAEGRSDRERIAELEKQLRELKKESK